MNLYRIFRRSSAQCLIFTVIFAFGAETSALAEEVNTVNVVISDAGDEISVVVDGEPVNPPPTGDTISGVGMISYEDAETDASINISVNDMTAIKNGSSVIAEVNDDIISSGFGAVSAISVGETSATVITENNVIVDSNIRNDFQATGARVSAEDDGSAAMTIGSDLTVTATGGDACGADVDAADGGTATLIVNGTLTADGEEKALGLDAAATGEAAEINVTAVEGITATGEFSVGAMLTATEGASVTLHVGDQDIKADLSGDTCGLILSTVGDEEKAAAGKVHAVITGTVSGDAASIVIAEGTIVENLSLTVWEIELNEDGHAVVEGSSDDSGNLKTEYTENAKAFEEKQIAYIIKVEQPTSGATLTAVKQDGSTLDKKDGFEVANENDTVLLKVDLQEGYKLTGAYSDKGQSIEMLQDAAGNYYVVVPKGGAVFLSATLENAEALVLPMSSVPAFTGGSAGGDTRIADGKYLLTLTARVRTMTFVRGTLERFARLNDAFLIKTPYGLFEISLSEILNFNEKAVNFRFDLTDEAFEIFANNEPAKSISLSEFA